MYGLDIRVYETHYEETDETIEVIYIRDGKTTYRIVEKYGAFFYYPWTADSHPEDPEPETIARGLDLYRTATLREDLRLGNSTINQVPFQSMLMFIIRKTSKFYKPPA